MSKLLFPPASDIRQSLTDWYLLIMLCLYALVCDSDGYSNILTVKYTFLLSCTSAWLIFLILLTVFQPRKKTPDRIHLTEKGTYTLFGLQTPELFAALFGIVCILSWLLSPWRARSLVGTSRHNGLITLLLLCLIFLGTVRFGRFTKTHCAALGACVCVYAAISAVQFYDLNPLGLYPSGKHHSDLRDFLGPIGNLKYLLNDLFCRLWQRNGTLRFSAGRR